MMCLSVEQFSHTLNIKSEGMTIMPEISLTAIWFILFVVFVVAEIATAGSLVSIWFCFGALAAMFAAMGGVSLTIQAVIFIAVSIILLILTKPFAKKILNGRIEATNAPALIGKHGIVTEEINNIEASGAVKVDGKIWTARSAREKEIIKEGAEVKILEIRGVKLIVETGE